MQTLAGAAAGGHAKLEDFLTVAGVLAGQQVRSCSHSAPSDCSSHSGSVWRCFWRLVPSLAAVWRWQAPSLASRCGRFFDIHMILLQIALEQMIGAAACALHGRTGFLAAQPWSRHLLKDWSLKNGFSVVHSDTVMVVNLQLLDGVTGLWGRGSRWLGTHGPFW